MLITYQSIPRKRRKLRYKRQTHCKAENTLQWVCLFIAIPENNASKTVQQSAKDKEGICLTVTSLVENFRFHPAVPGTSRCKADGIQGIYIMHGHYRFLLLPEDTHSVHLFSFPLSEVRCRSDGRSRVCGILL